MSADGKRRTAGGLRAAVGGLVVLLVLAALAFGAAWRTDQANPREHEFLVIVPKGTAILQSRGQDSLMVPQKLRLTLGDLDTLVIRNEDDFTLRVGPFRLEANQQYRQRFRSPGVFKLVCATMYHEDQVEITVVESPDLWRRMLAMR
ncbi:MAG: hypothetical protein ABIQ99_17155 [Thermoflexales bacterium]